MARLQPWYKVATPRADLRAGRPLDAAEFAVHLDQVREGRAHPDYQDPERFFARTFLTRDLTRFAAEVLRRLAGIQTETSAVFNLSTHFGGGKTHALALIYHLARHGQQAAAWPGVDKLLQEAGIARVPEAAIAVFVGTEFDSLHGRGGDDGTPRRHTPWGEIAWQLGGAESFAVVEEHERRRLAPGGDVIRRMLPDNRPVLILMDEVMNYMSRYREAGLADQLYTFLHNLSEVARNLERVVLAVSIPASELEMTARDQADFARLKKLLDRLGRAVTMASEAETAEIIRRRLFEWDAEGVDEEGRPILPKEAERTCREYARWVQQHRAYLPEWFPVDRARGIFRAAYPFHPVVISVFERKWQSLPRFQRTRGILRLLAHWVSRAYREGYEGAHRDALIGLGTAPLADSLFRRAVFEQLGDDDRLDAVVGTDIAGEAAFAEALDREAPAAIRRARLHRKVAISVFFESSGGQAQERKIATVPEIRLAVGEPALELAHVETVLDALAGTCYYLVREGRGFRFGLAPNLNKLLADRRASVDETQIEARVREEVRRVFARHEHIQRIFFPERSNEIPDAPVLTIVVMPPAATIRDAETRAQIARMTREHGASARTFKSALIWSVPESAEEMREHARTLLALEAIRDEEMEHLDEKQREQLERQMHTAKRDLHESVWRAYRHLMLLGDGNGMETMDLGLLHSSAAEDMVACILHRLREQGIVERTIGASFLVRHWPPALREWSTRAVRDAFYASPRFPRLLHADALKHTIARGVEAGAFAYAGKSEDGRYEPMFFETALDPEEVEFSDDAVLLKPEDARKVVQPAELTRIRIDPVSVQVQPGEGVAFRARGEDQFGRPMDVPHAIWHARRGHINEEGHYTAPAEEGADEVWVRCGELTASAQVHVDKMESGEPKPEGRIRWRGEVPVLKVMQFYTKVLTPFVHNPSLVLRMEFEVKAPDGIEKAQQVRRALRDLGLSDDVEATYD